MVHIFTVIILDTETSQVTGCELGRQLYSSQRQEGFYFIGTY